MRNNYKYMMTVIIPSYNNGKFISEAIDSVLNQEINFTLQIIISDDASNDDSVSIIQKYESTYPHIIKALYANKNAGLFENYYKAVKEMNSKYFCVLDPDDFYIDKKRLQKAVDFLEKNNDYTIFSMNAVAYNEKTKEEYRKYYPDMPIGEEHTSTFEDFLNGHAFLCNTPGSTFRNVMYSDEVITKIKYVCSNENNKAAFRADSGRNFIHLIKGKAKFVNEIVAKYRIHNNNMAQNMKEYERLIQHAQRYLVYDYFLDGKCRDKIYNRIFIYYRQAINAYSYELFDAKNILSTKNEYYQMFVLVHKWLEKYAGYVKFHEEKKFNISLLNNLNEKKIAIWGTGISSKRLISKYNIVLKEDDIYIDGLIKSECLEFLGRKVFAPSKLKLDDNWFVIICSSYYEEIMEIIDKEDLCPKDCVVNLYAFDRYYGVLE